MGVNVDESRPRTVLAFPRNPDDMLLSGALVGGHALSGRAQVLDAALGDGHVVMFAIRPFWRWQTQGTFFLGFNAILNWNDLDAGKGNPPRAPTRSREGRGASLRRPPVHLRTVGPALRARPAACRRVPTSAFGYGVAGGERPLPSFSLVNAHVARRDPLVLQADLAHDPEAVAGECRP